MTRHNQDAPQISKSYLLGLSSKPFKEEQPAVPPQVSHKSRHVKMLNTPGAMVEWFASDGRKGKFSKNLHKLFPPQDLTTANLARVPVEAAKLRTHKAHPRTRRHAPTFQGTFPNAPPGSVVGSEGGFGGLLMNKLEAVAAEQKTDTKQGWSGNNDGNPAAGDGNPHGFTKEQDDFIMERRTANVGEPWANVANDLPGDQKSADQCKERFKAIKPKDWKPNNSKGGNKGEGKQKGKNKGDKGNKKQEEKKEGNAGAEATWNTPGNDNGDSYDNNFWNSGGGDNAAAENTWNTPGNDNGDRNDNNFWNSGSNDNAWNNGGDGAGGTGGDNNTGEAEGNTWNPNGYDNAGAGDTGDDGWGGGFNTNTEWGATGDGENANNADDNWHNDNSNSKTQKLSKDGRKKANPKDNGAWGNNNNSKGGSDKANDWGNGNGGGGWSNHGGNENRSANENAGNGRNNRSSSIVGFHDIYPDSTFSMDDLTKISRLIKRDHEQVWFRLSCAFRDKTGRHIPPHVFKEKLTGEEAKKDS